ncbi:unnamed protein product [Eruca vesicaria subsp. sativa]|uniref:Uncharacterized protein n=1 Tax=Eruca vesicaria subsp. sativa TaxID=29727 RepID=A0ABC8J0Z5_ERUVS|nr:unnamed protein product [Eruca vesicaria subsp. sativa]
MELLGWTRLEVRMRKPNTSKVVGRTAVKKQLLALGRMLARGGGEVDSSRKPLNSLAAGGGASMQIVCVDDCSSGLVYDLDYMKYITTFKESHQHLLEREASPLRIMYNVDKEATGRSKGKEVSRGRRRSEPLLLKKLKTGTRKEERKLTVFRKEVVLRGRKIAMTKAIIKVEPRRSVGKDIQQEKEASLRGRKKIDLTKSTTKLEPKSHVRDTRQEQEVSLRAKKIALPKNTIKLEPTSDVKDTHQEKEVTRRGRKPKSWNKLDYEESSGRRDAKPQTVLRASKRLKAEKIIPAVNTKDASQGEKSSVTKRNLKVCKKENEESSSEWRKAKPQEILRASKRLKTEQGRADTKRKKEEAPHEGKIHVNKDKAKAKSTSHLKDNLMDKSYEYFIASLRKSVTLIEADPVAKPERALVLSDPDIIAVSNCPFFDGGYSPFEANKDGKVIDLEDRIEPEDMFNSKFSKKLLEILRQPYDKDEFKQRYLEASHKKQLTRSRQLRDGREIEYNVDHQLGPSYLDRYPDFKRVFRRSRCVKDDARALNLLRGFFFYFENIVLEGAFKPWLHETRVMRECKDIVCIKAEPHNH